jgi:hypothetical protein
LALNELVEQYICSCYDQQSFSDMQYIFWNSGLLAPYRNTLNNVILKFSKMKQCFKYNRIFIVLNLDA